MVLSNRRLLCFSKTWATPSPTTPIVETIVRAALARIQAAVGKRETVNLVGFGRFEVYERGARRGRNLRTGDSLKIPASRAVRLKAGKRLRDATAGSKRKRPGKDRKELSSAVARPSNPIGFGTVRWSTFSPWPRAPEDTFCRR
jgi:DNA-binding protein HU-beta